MSTKPIELKHSGQATERNNERSFSFRKFVLPFTRILQRQYLYYKEKGLIEFIKHICKDAIDYEKYQVMETDLSEKIEIKDAKIPVNIRILTTSEEDISKIVAFWPEVYSPPFSTPESIKEMIIKRLAAGEICNIAEYEGKIVHMGWQGFQNTHLWNPYVRKRGLKSDEFLAYNVFCSPEYRGNNIMRAVGSRSYRRVKEMGYRKLIGYTQPNNKASIKSAESNAARPVQTLYWLNIFGWNIYYLTKRRD